MNYLKKVSLSACLFLCSLSPVQVMGAETSWEFTPVEKLAYQDIISLRFDETLPLMPSDRPATAYLNNLKGSIALIITEDPVLFDVYEDRIAERIALIQSKEDGDPYKKFYLAELHLQHAFVRLKLGYEWSAAWDFRRAYKLVKENTAKFPQFLPNYKTLGLLHIMIGSVPDQYQWLLSVLGMEGSIKQGVKELTKMAESNHLFHLEAKAIRYLLDSYLFNRSAAAVSNFKNIYDAHPENKLLGYLYMSLLIKNAESARALAVFHHLRTLREQYFTLNFLQYMAGEIYLQKGDYALAENHLKFFIERNRGRNFTKDAHYKLFLVYWLKGHQKQAVEAHTLAQSVGKAQIEADKHAAKSLSQPQFPNRSIMKIRLATDGGFYDQAEKLVSQPPLFNSKKEKIEFIYRKARLSHKTGKISEAIAFYLETINASAGEHWYFAPNACLQLGYIYREEGDVARSKYFFNEVVSFNGHEYKNSLDNKAKVALAAYEQ